MLGRNRSSDNGPASPTSSRRRSLEASHLLDTASSPTSRYQKPVSQDLGVQRQVSSSSTVGEHSSGGICSYRGAVVSIVSVVLALLASSFMLQVIDLDRLRAYSDSFTRSPSYNLPAKLRCNEDSEKEVPYTWPEVPFFGQPIQVLDTRTLPSVLAQMANSRGEVIFTTFLINPSTQSQQESIDAFTSNLVGSLIASGVPKVLLIGADQYSCSVTKRHGNISCFVDGMHRSEGVQFAFGYAVYLKWLYLHAILEAGYHAIFADNDVVFRKDPFLYFDPTYDFQGLLDVGDPAAGMDPLQGKEPEFAVDLKCPLKTPPVSYRDHFPCMSTGLMFARSNALTLHLTSGMVFHMQADPGFWEQKMFQEKVMSYLIHVGNGLPAMNFRLLPLENFHNVWSKKVRDKLKLPIDTVALHCGYLHGTKAKAAALRELWAWDPSWWQKAEVRVHSGGAGRRFLLGHDRCNNQDCMKGKV